jgi:hypothetical protein
MLHSRSRVHSPAGEFITPGGLLVPAGGGAAFDPTTVAGLARYYDAPQLGLANGALVSSFTDLSGSGVHAVQTDAARQPVIATDPTTGLQVVSFDGVDNVIGATLPAVPRTVFLAVKSIGVAGHPYAHGNNTTTNARIVTGAGPVYEWTRNAALAQVALGSASGWRIITLGYESAAALHIYNNDGAAASFDPDDVATSTEFKLGGRGSLSSGTAYWNGYVGSMLVYDSLLGQTDREYVRDGLMAQWVP